MKYSTAKLGSSTHAWDSGQRLIDLRVSQADASSVRFETPALSHQNVPGYYMLFYVSEKGQPSIAEIVQLSSKPS